MARRTGEPLTHPPCPPPAPLNNNCTPESGTQEPPTAVGGAAGIATLVAALVALADAQKEALEQFARAHEEIVRPCRALLLGLGGHANSPAGPSPPATAGHAVGIEAVEAAVERVVARVFGRVSAERQGLADQAADGAGPADLLTAEEFGRRLKKTTSAYTIRRWVKERRLRVERRPGGPGGRDRLLFARSELERVNAIPYFPPPALDDVSGRAPGPPAPRPPRQA